MSQNHYRLTARALACVVPRFSAIFVMRIFDFKTYIVCYTAKETQFRRKVMAAEKKNRRIKPAELLEMLDLEERMALASEIGLTLPKTLNDQAFASSITEFSATTLLRTIVRLRSPVIEMLKEVYQFLKKEEVRGRTTVWTVVLPKAKGDLEVLFNPALKEAVVTALDKRAMSTSIDSLEELAQELKDRIKTCMNSIPVTWVRSETEESLDMKSDPYMAVIAHQFRRQRKVYHRQDYEHVLEYYNDLRDFVEKLEDVKLGSNSGDWLSVQMIETVFEELRNEVDSVQVKLREMNRGQPSG